MAHVTEQTPLLQDESAPPTHTADERQNTISNGSDHPHGYSWRAVAIGQWFSLIGGLAVFGLAAAVSVIHRHCRPDLYYIARDIRSYLETMVILVRVTEVTSRAYPCPAGPVVNQIRVIGPYHRFLGRQQSPSPSHVRDANAVSTLRPPLRHL